jgi:homoserine O-acetyltransferase
MDYLLIFIEIKIMKLICCALAVLLFFSCNRAVFKTKWAYEKAPATYIVRFETSKGLVDVKVNREWSPLAADRFYQLAKHHFPDSAVFYRVVPNFVAQFGSSDIVKINKWSGSKVPDEPVLHSNTKGSISFARGGKETRGIELFINLKDNLRLDTINYNGVKGFPAFGDVIKGMDVVSSLTSKYGDSTMNHLGEMYSRKDAFKKSFPGLDIIRKVYVGSTR